MSKTHGTSQIGGCPSLKDQARNRHEEGQTRIDVEMGKLIPRAVKHFIKLFKQMEAGKGDFKINQQLTILEKVFQHNKEYSKILAEELAKDSVTEEAYEEDDEEMSICLTSAPSEDKPTLN